MSTPKAPKMREFLKHHPLYYLPQWQTTDMITCWKLIGGPDVGKDVFFGPLAKDMWQDVKTTCEASGFDVNSIEFKEMMWRRLIKELGHVPRRIFNPVISLAQRDTELRALKQVWIWSVLFQDVFFSLKFSTSCRWWASLCKQLSTTNRSFRMRCSPS